jgi:hypothetical protein
VFEALAGDVPYDTIRLVASWLRGRAAQQ